MRKYALRNEDGAIRGFTLTDNGDPIDESSQEWTAYIASLSNKTRASKRLVMNYLKGTGEWSQVKTLLDNNQDARDDWDTASYLDINDPTLNTMAQALGWDSTKLQTIFNAVAE